MSIKLSVVDQSPIQGLPENTSPVTNSIELAKACDRLGFHRYWFAEHHNSVNFVGTCPEILIGHIATQTERIKLGSGGVMLTHYSPYKVAEQFSMLAALHPDRIDLGIGRAPGGDQVAAHALAYPGQPGRENYAEQAWLLKHFIDGTLPADNPYASLRVTHDPSSKPELWMLGSSGGSAELAGQVGMYMTLALFISPDAAPPSVVQAYKSAWRASGHSGEPKASLAVAGVCADTQEEAEYLATPAALWKTMVFRQGRRELVKHPDVARDLAAQLNASDKAFFDAVLNSMIVGSVSHWEQRLETLASAYDCEEIGILTVTHDAADRLASYERLAALIA